MLFAISLSKSQPDKKLTDSQTDAVPPGMLYSDAGYETDVERRSLKRRAITRAAKGIAAVEKLLTGATKVATQSKNYRAYKKNGDIQSALQDFYSVEPALVNKRQNDRKAFSRHGRHGQVITGTVGDRRIILLPNGDGYSRHSPVLEIRSITDADYDRIVYKPTEN